MGRRKVETREPLIWLIRIASATLVTACGIAFWQFGDYIYLIGIAAGLSGFEFARLIAAKNRKRNADAKAFSVFDLSPEPVDTKPYAIFLRPFWSDGKLFVWDASELISDVVMWPFTLSRQVIQTGRLRNTLESRIADGLDPQLDLLRIGGEADRDPGAGTARLHNDVWFERFKAVAPQARMIFLVPLVKRGSATYDEMQFIHAQGLLERTVLIMPQTNENVADITGVVDAWQISQQILQDDFGIILPSYDPLGGVILFENGQFRYFAGAYGAFWTDKKFFKHLAAKTKPAGATIAVVRLLVELYLGLFVMAMFGMLVAYLLLAPISYWIDMPNVQGIPLVYWVGSAIGGWFFLAFGPRDPRSIGLSHAWARVAIISFFAGNSGLIVASLNFVDQSSRFWCSLGGLLLLVVWFASLVVWVQISTPRQFLGGR